MEESVFNLVFDFVGGEVVGLSFFAGAVTYLVITILKKNMSLNKNYIPLIAVGVSIIVSIFSYVFIDLELTLRIWSGIFGGFISIAGKELLSKRDGFTTNKK